MRWPNKNIGSICLETFNGNPQNNPEKKFFYIDISSIDNVIKKIVTYQVLLGKNAPSRARKLINAGDILVSTVRPNLNAVAIVPLELNGQIASTGFCVLRANPELVDNQYLFYRTISMDFITYLSTSVTGANYPAVTDSVVKSAPIPLPPLKTQKKIAAILEKADAARERRRQANQLNEQFLQSAFLEMFGDPATNPKRWEKKTFGDCITNIRYATGSPPFYVEQGIPFIRATNIKRGTVVSKDMKYISPEDAATIPKCKVQTGDLIIVRSGINAGDCGIIPNEYNGAYAAYDLIVNLPKASAVFFNHLLNSSFGKAVLTPLKRRAGQPHLNAEQITSLVFSVPPLSEQQKFAELVEKVDVLRTKQRQSEQELGNLFNSLMQRAFRGELVPQDPHDEPASELLKRIKEERVAREAKIETEKRRSKEKFLKNNIN